MEKYRIKAWEWAVAAMPLLVALFRLCMSDTPEVAVGTAKVYTFVSSLIYSAVELWAIWCIYRMARWQERKSWPFMALFVVALLSAVISLVQIFFPLGGNAQIALRGAIGLLMLVAGIVATVRLFSDGVKPLGLIMVLWIIVPMVISLVIPAAFRAHMLLAYAVEGILSAVLVSLMFLFRNAPGEVE